MTNNDLAGSPAGTPTHAQFASGAAPVLISIAGRCRPNPGPGSYAWIARHPDGAEVEGSGPSLTQTTSIRMAMAAAITALEKLQEPSTAIVQTDSEYLQINMERRVVDWQASGWRTKKGQPVANKDLWERLLAAAAPHEITWVWIGKDADNATSARVGSLADKALANRARLAAAR